MAQELLETKSSGTAAGDVSLAAEPWGKLNHDEKGVESGRLSLAAHSLDVSSMFEQLICAPIIRRRFETLAQRALNANDIARLCFLAFIHDVGKVAIGFQSGSIAQETKRWKFLATLGLSSSDIGHLMVAKALTVHRELYEIASLGSLEIWAGESAVDYYCALLSHHGTPLTLASFTGTGKKQRSGAIEQWQAAAGYDPKRALAELVRVGKEAFPSAFDAVEKPLPSEAEFIHLFAGLLNLADWLASNAADGFFPFYTPEENDRREFGRRRAKKVLELMSLSRNAEASVKISSRTFEEVFGVRPFPLQSAMDNTDLGRLVIVEAETGSGKTEAALWRFKTLFDTGEVDSIFFALPTRVSAVAMEKRLLNFAETAFPNPKERPNVVLAVPGYIRADGEEGQKSLLAKFETLWPESMEEAAQYRRWAAESSKRFLAAAAAVGTVDQVLLSGLMVRHAQMRGALLLRSLLVVDEVHASDRFMTEVLKEVLRRQVSAGGHALLLSATLASDVRDELLSAAHGTSVVTSSNGAFPAITDVHGLRPAEASERRKKVTTRIAPIATEPEQIAKTAIDAAKAGAVVLVVRNTVRDALALQLALESLLDDSSLHFTCKGARNREIVTLHHGRFVPEDRRLLDEAIETTIGRDAERRGRIVVGTQTLEQSLDIDADFLITDIAPIDVFLQRVGRLHRHKRESRPKGFEQATVLTLIPAVEDFTEYLSDRNRRPVGIGTVYQNVVQLEACRRLLAENKSLELPAQNRLLVEAGVNREKLYSFASEMGNAWIEHLHRREGEICGQEGVARIHKLSWLTHWQEMQWPANEKIATRLGQNTAIVRLSKTVETVFGNKISSLPVPAWMIPKLCDIDAVGEVVRTDYNETVFTWNGATFCYNRLGLQPLESGMDKEWEE